MAHRLLVAALVLMGLLAVYRVSPDWAMGAAVAVTGLSTWFYYFRKDSPPQFSLRDLIIATTVIAVVLGLGAWLAS